MDKLIPSPKKGTTDVETLESTKKPNFFIVGAARAGTTTLYHVLRKHPDVFMSSPIKEPSFFAGQYKGNIRTWHEYLELFKAAKKEKIVGEASTIYLYDENAPKEIKENIKDAKILIQLRNPVERAISHYKYLKINQKEKLNFKTALAEERRRKEKGFHPDFYYFQRSLYFPQVKRFYDCFDKNSVKVTIFEEFIKNPKKTLEEIYKFLDIDPKFLPRKIKQYNQSSEIRFPRLKKIIASKSKIKKNIKALTPKKIRLKLRDVTFQQFLLSYSKIKINFSEADKTCLLKQFMPDIKKLEKLIGRDLSIWLPSNKLK